MRTAACDPHYLSAAIRRSKCLASIVSISTALGFYASTCVASTEENQTSVTGALIGYAAGASEEFVDDDYFVVLDLDVVHDLGFGSWNLYIEGTSTSKETAVSNIYKTSIADAGSASDADGGRIQASELFYTQNIGATGFSLGLLYPAEYTEPESWANDESNQFVSTPFTNIQTIANPDYALGIGFRYPLKKRDEGFDMNLLVSQAQGLGDLDGSYHRLFSEFDDYFYSAEFGYNFGLATVRIGGWGSSLDTLRFDGADLAKNYGGNISAAFRFLEVDRLLFRVGLANRDVSAVSEFVGASYQLSFDVFSFGLGHTVMFASSETQLENMQQSELYMRFSFIDALALSLSGQYIKNAWSDSAAHLYTSPTIVTGRLSYTF